MGSKELFFQKLLKKAICCWDFLIHYCLRLPEFFYSQERFLKSRLPSDHFNIMLIIRKMFSRCLRPLAQQKQQIHVNFLNRFTFKLMLDACYVWRIKLDCITNTSSPFVTHPIIYSYSHIHPTACWKELVWN